MQTAQTTAQPSTPSFTVGSLLSRTFSILFRRIGLFCGLALIPALFGTAVGFLTFHHMLSILSAMKTSHGLPVSGSVGLQWEVVISGLIGAILGVMVQGAFGYAVYRIRRNEPVALGMCLAHGFRQFPALFGVSVMLGLLFYIGTFTLGIASLIGALLFGVAAPVCVVEKLGAIDSMKRSLTLTSGARGRLFGALVVLAIIFVIVNGLCQWPTFSTYQDILVGTARGQALSVSTYLLIGGGFFLNVLVSSLLSNVMTAVAYFDLRADKEGISVQNLADVFA